MATCYQKHPFEIESEDKLTTINTKIFEIKKKIQLSEGQRKSHYEENEAEKKQNSDFIETLKTEIKLRIEELVRAREIVADEEAVVKKYLNEVCPIGNKTSDQLVHNLDLKVIEQRKILDLLKYEKGSKKKKLRDLEVEYEKLLIESTKSDLVKSKISTRARKNVSHLENEIHKVLIQWTEAELVKKKYFSIRQALVEDSVKFESSLSRIEDLLKKQKEEIKKLELVREEAADMRIRATAATAAEAARAHGDEHGRAAERAFFAQRFEERKRELEKLEKRIFPPASFRPVRQESRGSTEGEAVTEELSAAAQMEEIFQRLMKLTGVTEPEEVFDRFRAQRETLKRLNYLQQTTEEEKLQLEETQTTLMGELEGYKYASVKDKDEGQDEIIELKAKIEEEDKMYEELQKNYDDLDAFLLEIKRLLYDLYKMLDVVGEPAMPEWTAEARDISQILSALSARLATASARAAALQRRTDQPAASSTPSGAQSLTGASARSPSTMKDSEKILPTYKELVTREPVKPPPSDEEEDIPSRFYLKRQAQVIVDTKCRRKGFRTAYPRK